MPASPKPVWFITGCSTGFGRELAQLLLARGYNVVVTARDPSKLQDFTAGFKDTALALPLDVARADQIASAVAQAVARFGRLDVLVNNAGYGYLAAVEEGEDAEIRAMFDANFFGLAAMTRAVLPQMRQQKAGHIVNISSVGGFVGFPGSGYYAGTKFAVQGLSEALALEMAPHGVRVLVVEPGPFRTDWAGRSLKTPQQENPAYADTAVARRQRTASYSGNQPGDPVRGCEAIIEAVEAQKPPFRLALGKMAVETIRAKLDAMRQELEAWEKTALGADFPDEQKLA